MIQMPHRSVTRFFIPLIDVLLLTFGVFLLMPIAAETELDAEREKVAEQGETTKALQKSLQDRLKELYDLYELEQLRPELERVKELKQEIDALRKPLMEGLTVKVIETDPKTGEIFYYDPSRADDRVPIPDRKAAQALIAQQKKDFPGRMVYYQFLRRRGLLPTFAQGQQYREWFKDVPNSLEVRQ
jgi:hypothetical protein